VVLIVTTSDGWTVITILTGARKGMQTPNNEDIHIYYLPPPKPHSNSVFEHFLVDVSISHTIEINTKEPVGLL
jgi:hypothetical protein